ncbi:hypothetical protein HD554DRAFT_2165880 [Boletus coccyginus]|nr:hypothetical protein HD554DRAFT_2165880 [Boletus coccyginus]
MPSGSSLESTLKNIQISGYTAVIIITVVGYDYILTLSREIDNIWRRPWTRVSVLFLVVRYIGLCWGITLALTGSAFMPGPLKANVGISILTSGANQNEIGYYKGAAMLVVGDWGYMLFLAAADLVMILRVYAMWNRSRIILYILLFFYVPQVVVSAVWEGIYNNPNGPLSVTVVQVLNFRYCSYTPHGTPSSTYRAIPRYFLGTALLILAAIPTFRQSNEMYKLTKRWKTNRSMNLLLKEGAAYFVVNLFFNIVFEIELSSVDLTMFLDTLSYSLSCAIMPRFIISIRELYDRDLQNRWQGIDTGFGVLVASENADGTTIALENIGRKSGRR